MEQLQGNPQDTVQLKMGRCILRLQQYETLIKSMVAMAESSGYANDIKKSQAWRKERVGSKTLGQLVGELTGSHLCISGGSGEELAESQTAELDPERVHFRASFRTEMRVEDYHGQINPVV